VTRKQNDAALAVSRSVAGAAARLSAFKNFKTFPIGKMQQLLASVSCEVTEKTELSSHVPKAGGQDLLALLLALLGKSQL
jgi:hypothetical protein